MNLATVAFACPFLCLGPLEAQERPVVPIAVETVVSGGYWTAPDNIEGQYRVIVKTEGFEHLVSSAWLEWIAAPTKDSDATVVATSELVMVEAGSVRLSEPVFSIAGKQWILTITATQTHCDPMPIERRRLALGPPGRIAVLPPVVLKKGCAP